MTQIKSFGYTVYSDEQAFKSLSRFLTKNNYGSVFILCDENTLQHCIPILVLQCPQLGKAQLIEIESGEASKSINICTSIWQTLNEQGGDKYSLIINLGGGVVSDLGGFVASLFKRGIDFVNIPTSLLAMADASVGGKTGIDFMGMKNNIGTFAQPKMVIISPPFLNTLPLRHRLNGWVEVFKIALVANKNFWFELKKVDLEKNPGALILKSVALKNNIVLKDPFDRSIRKILNFGHSLGHAIESLLLETEYELLHGEAICIGMILESHIALQKKLISKKEYVDITTTLKIVFQPNLGLDLNVDALLKIIKGDKKNKSSKFRFSLLKGIGICAYDCEVSESHIKKALGACLQK